MKQRGIPSRFEPELVPSEEVSARIRAAIAATPAPRASTTVYVAVAMAIVPIAAAVVHLVACWLIYDRPVLRADFATRPPSKLIVELLLVAALTLAATLVALERGERGLGAGVTALVLATLLVTPIYAVLALMSPSVAHEAAAPELSPWGLRCLSLAAAVGLVVLAILAVALRRAVPVASRLRGAALGAAAGAWAGMSVFLFCPATDVQHLVVGHVMPIAACTLLGRAALPRALRP